MQDSDRKSVTFDSPQKFTHVWVGIGDIGRSTGKELLEAYLAEQGRNYPDGLNILEEVTAHRTEEAQVARVRYRLRISHTYCEEEFQEWVWVKSLKYYWLQMGTCVHAMDELKTATDTQGRTPCEYARHSEAFTGTPLLGRLCKP